MRDVPTQMAITKSEWGHDALAYFYGRIVLELFLAFSATFDADDP
jgi:hypothetical protein